MNIYHTLKEYPTLIYEQELLVLERLKAKQNAKSDLDYYLLGVDQEIANNEELKNETMRKAFKKQILIDSPIYQQLNQNYEVSKHNYKLALLELDLIKNEFSVIKLDTKMAILKWEEAIA